MNDTRINYQQAIGVYKTTSKIEPAYPVDLVRLATRQPDVSSNNTSRISDLESRIKELEGLTLELQDRLSLTEDELRDLKYGDYIGS